MRAGRGMSDLISLVHDRVEPCLRHLGRLPVGGLFELQFDRRLFSEV